jgi:hypothetical protein
VTFAAHVLEKLYPARCVAYGEALDRRVNYNQTEVKEVNSSFRRFVNKGLGASNVMPPIGAIIKQFRRGDPKTPNSGLYPRCDFVI